MLAGDVGINQVSRSLGQPNRETGGDQFRTLHLPFSCNSSFYPQPVPSNFLLALLHSIISSSPVPATILCPPVALIRAICYLCLSFLSHPCQPLACFLTLFPCVISMFFSIGLTKTPANLTNSYVSSRLSACSLSPR
jgi:hypothetical protein